MDVPTWTDEPRDPWLCHWVAAHWECHVSCACASLRILARPKGLLAIAGAWCLGYLWVAVFYFGLLSALCSSNSGIIFFYCSDVLWLLSKETWKHTKSEDFMKSLFSGKQGQAFLGCWWYVKMSCGSLSAVSTLPGSRDYQLECQWRKNKMNLE